MEQLKIKSLTNGSTCQNWSSNVLKDVSIALQCTLFVGQRYVYGAAVLWTLCKITSPVLEVGLFIVASQRHFSTHCTDTIIIVPLSVGNVGGEVSIQRSSPGSKYSGSKSEVTSLDCGPSHRNSTLTVVLRVGSQWISGIGHWPQYFGRKRFRLRQGPKRKNIPALRRCVALHSWPL